MWYSAIKLQLSLDFTESRDEHSGHRTFLCKSQLATVVLPSVVVDAGADYTTAYRILFAVVLRDRYGYPRNKRPGSEPVGHLQNLRYHAAVIPWDAPDPYFRVCENLVFSTNPVVYEG